MNNLFKLALSLLLLATVSNSARAANVSLVATGATWKYFKGVSEASTPSTAWRQAAYNDSSWASGGAPLGYGETYIVTDLGAGSVNPTYTSAYFRKTFNVTTPSDYSQVVVEVTVDDGAVAFLNGVEVGRANVGDGERLYSDVALLAEETRVLSITLNSNLLVSGQNVLAVHVFNSGTTSSDLVFDASLTAVIDDVGPLVGDTIPPVNSIVRELTSIEVVFNESVTGVNASDLLIKGVPATSVSSYSPRGYIFTFTQPSTGAVQVAWAAGHGITDLSAAHNAFAGGSWSYTLNTNVVVTGVTISEFMASNKNGLKDEDGDRSDWIELRNGSTEDVNLAGWSLTDEIGNKRKWVFPTVNLAPNQYLLVFASNKNKTNGLARLHTNFQLGGGGEYLGLYNPQTNVVWEYASEYPPQSDDISYGLDRVDAGIRGYFFTPTPGAANSVSGPGVSVAPTFSIPGGIYTNSSLSLVLTAPSGTIRWTTNGTIPTNTSTAYTGPITINSSTIVKARVFDGALIPSSVGVEAYNLIGSGLANFSSRLPLLVLNTGGRAVARDVAPGGVRTPASLTVIDTFRGRASLTDHPEFQGPVQMEIRGQTSADFNKKPYGFEINDGSGEDQAVGLLGMPAESDWVLTGPYSDKVFINNFLAHEMFEQMGHYAVRRRFVEVFTDLSGGKLDYPADYAGIYILLEKIKVDKNRVDITKLLPTQNTEPEISGGYIFKKDKPSPGDVDFATTGGNGFAAQALKIHEPKPREVTTAQLTWLRTYLNQFEAALYATNWLTRTGTNHYSNYVDVDSMVDQHWIVEFTKQIDGYRLSNYMSKDRGAKVKIEPIWDWNLSFGNANYLQGGLTNGWYWNNQGEGMTSAEHIWLRRLIYGVPNILAANPVENSGDPDFLQKVTDRWSVLRTNVMNADRLNARVDELAELLSESAVRDNAKYLTWGVYLWPNPNGPPAWSVDYQNPTTYQGLINEMKKFIRGRFLWIDNQYLRIPQLSQLSGPVQPGFTLRMTAVAGTIYYTTDGTDPRLPGGAVSPAAQVYGSGVVIQNNARIFARALSGNKWSGPAVASYVVTIPSLIISEIMYHPAPAASGNTNSADNYEYVELKNIGATVLNLSGFRFVSGITFDFTGGAITSLNPGQSVLVVANKTSFTNRYGATAAANIAGQYTGELANSGERIVLEGPLGEVVHDFSYNDTWYPVTDGVGFSLVVANENAPRTNWDLRIGWRAGNIKNGTPGQSEAPDPGLAPILITEALTHTDLPDLDSIELYNPTSTNVNIGGWFLSDDAGEPKYRIPDNTIIGPNAYRVFTEAQFNAPQTVGTNFTLRSLGDEVFLFSADAAGNLTGYAQGYSFGAALNGVSFGRYITSQQVEHFVAQESKTLGSANSGPKVGPIVISELMYRPADVFANNNYWDNFEDEFIELQNITAFPVLLADPNAPTNTWRLRDAVQYAFPTNITLASNERILVVNFDPVLNSVQANAFRSKYSVGVDVRLFGPYSGKLDNSQESVELVQPDLIHLYTNVVEVSDVLIDKIEYGDRPPWSAAADGVGYSLQRLSLSSYGNDPANWTAAAATPGAANHFGAAPVIRRQPAARTVVATNPVTFDVDVSGQGPFQYQWRYQGAVLNGAIGPSLTLSNVQPNQAGGYQVIVLNSVNSAVSQEAMLTVLIPASIVANPQPVDSAPGGNASFSVAAVSSTEIHYQWRKNGIPINGATSTTYSLSNVQPVDDAFYDVTLTDSVGTIFTPSVRLTVLISPIITINPVPSTNFLGGSVTFSVEVTNTATLPIGFRWRKGGTTLASHIVNRRSDFITLTNLQATDAASYSVVVTNKAFSTPGNLSKAAALTVIAIVDTDGDGIPDAYEDAHNMNKNSAADAALDPDGDGMSNRSEYIAGTDPQDPLSYLKVDSITPGSGVQIKFRAVSSKTYSVLSSSSPSGPWQVLAAIAATSGSATDVRTATVVDDHPPVLGERYYRLATPAIGE